MLRLNHFKLREGVTIEPPTCFSDLDNDQWYIVANATAR